MFRPQDFYAPRASRTNISAPKSNGPIVIDKLVDNQVKSKWDQPLIIPEILYQKFDVPLPKNERKKQAKTYPSQLIDYIKRAYARCQSEPQRKNMENQLRKIISSNENNLNEVSWKTYPLPQIAPSKQREITKQKSSSQVNLIKKGQIRIPSSYKIVDQEKPSKAMILAQKRLQKLQEKLKSQKQEENKKQQKQQSFIGFRQEADVKKAQPKLLPNPIMGRIIPPPQQPPKVQVQKRRVVQSKQKSEVQNPKEKQKKQNKFENSSGKKITKKELEIVKKSKESQEKINVVAKRYAQFNKIKSDNYQKHQIDGQNDRSDQETIIGKSKNIEKPYLRITGRPNPDTVRPEKVLKKALKHFLEMYKKGCNYEYLISQFRSIRQDLTVQNIKNSFTVQVYQQNFKISLFQNDVVQFKHLQTRIWQLYSQGLYYTQQSKIKFISYQLITLIIQQKNQNLEYMMTQIPPQSLCKVEIQNCLRLKRMLMLGNYRGFFDFYNSCETVTRYLLNHYIDRVRMQCLLMICRTCGQKISIANLSSIISEDEDVLESLVKAEGGILSDGYLMLKPSYEKFKDSELLATKKVSVLLD